MAEAVLTHARDSGSIERLSLRHYVWIFVLCSIGGLIVETIVSYPIDGIWKDRAGLVWGPFSPIYGFGAVLLTLFLNRLRSAHPLMIFCASALLGAGFELIAGVFWKYAFGIVAWSYIDQPFNIGGYTCLSMALCWGALGLVWVKALLPPVVRAVDAVPDKIAKVLTAAMVAFLVANVAVTLLAFNYWFDRQTGHAVGGPVETYFAQHYSDAFMADRFQTMSMWTDLASR